jgi:prophage antirepressor-like protein
VDQGGEPWFVTGDVCRALDVYIYNGKLNTASALRKLDDSEKKLEGVNRIHPSAFDPRIKNVWLISESGLYKLVMRSDKREAKAFQDWVTKIVLPAIRKDGMYVAGEEKVRTGERLRCEQITSGTFRYRNAFSLKLIVCTNDFQIELRANPCGIGIDQLFARERSW